MAWGAAPVEEPRRVVWVQEQRQAALMPRALPAAPVPELPRLVPIRARRPSATVHQRPVTERPWPRCRSGSPGTTTTESS